MGQITIEKNVAGVEGLTLFYPTLHLDNRGCFFEAYNERELAEREFNVRFIQDNQSISHKGVLRGLHSKKNYPQRKLVRAITGSFYDVAVDLRKCSPTYEIYYGTILSSENHLQMYSLMVLHTDFSFWKKTLCFLQRLRTISILETMWAFVGAIRP